MKTTFELDRKSGVPLSDQLVSRLKTAIVRGVYKPGGTLPGIIELAEAAGVREKVSRMAMRRLSDEGWISTRRHVGSVVLARTGNVVRWRVLFFSHNPYFCFHTDRLVSEMRTRLMREKGGVSTIAISRCRGANSYLQLEELLKERWDLIIENDMDATSRKMIEDSGWPFVVVGGASLAGGRGSVIGCIAAAGILGIISNILNLTGASSYYQYVLQGVLLIAALTISALRANK